MLLVRRACSAPWDGGPVGGCQQAGGPRWLCHQGVSGQLWVSSALPSGSQPFPTLAVFSGCHNHSVLLPGTALVLACQGPAGPILESTSHSTACTGPLRGDAFAGIPWENLPQNGLWSARALQILPKYPRLSSASDTNPMETRYFCAGTGTHPSGRT